MHKIIKIVLIVIGAIGTILWFQLPSADVPASEAVNSGAMGFMFVISYILLGISIAATLIFGLLNLFSSKGGLKKALFILGGFLVVFAVSYGLSVGTDVSLDEMSRVGVPTSVDEVRMIGTGLNIFFILTLIAVGAMLFGGVKKAVGK